MGAAFGWGLPAASSLVIGGVAQEQKDDLHAVLVGWAQETEGGFAALPKGIFELVIALHADLDGGV